MHPVPGEWKVGKPRWTTLRPLTERAAKDVRRYDPTDRRFLGKDRCFLCGTKLTPTTRTAEHVFPKWLLNRYRLWDERLTLLNGTSMSYRRIRVPSCKRCNGRFLGSLERRVEQAVRGGYETFKRLPRQVIFQWLTKVFFQILYLEMRLAKDVAVPDRGTILTPEFVDEFRLEHVLLNSVRVPVRIAGAPPWSIFIVPTQASTRRCRNFDFLDNTPNQVIAFRMGDVGVIAALVDGHAQEEIFRSYFRNLARRVRLHPIQFRELASKVIYKRHTMNRTPRFMTTWHEDGKWFQVLSLPVAGLSSRPVFDDWQNSEYARVLHFYVGAPFGVTYEELFVPPNHSLTFIRDARNRYKHIDIETDLLALSSVTNLRRENA
jgi:hypothetical protein